MGLLYKREELDFQFLPYVVFFGIYTQDGHIQIRVCTLCFKSVPQDLVFDLPDVHSIDITVFLC